MSARAESCQSFRAALTHALEGRPQPERLRQLGWHEHLLGCADCRELLECEEALEHLLATLPEPKLPPDLTRRVIRRLESDAGAGSSLDELLALDSAGVPAGLAGRIERGARSDAALDALLDRDQVAVPSGLAARLGAALAARQERDLDQLLELDEVTAPAGLSSRLLVSLEAEHAPPARKHPLRLLRSPLLYAAAAALVLFLTLLGRDDVERGDQVASLPVGGRAEPDPELLAALDVLERDELWSDTAAGGSLAPGEDADLELLLSESVDIDDELLLAYLAEEDL
jgi:hypothetical protein